MRKLDFLIDYLMKENNEIYEIPKNVEEKERLFRSLCNIREPKGVTDEFLKVQDEFLKEELERKGITKDIEDSNVEGKIYL